MGYELSKFFCCMVCGWPMIGIIKPSADNMGARTVARDECEGCVKALKEAGYGG